ncbi:MAG: DUF2939 domain-containing protein [Burkholderiaceae bacterium]|nr:DUF2939 domain-containing protein [Burkholderiaceae bacterium]
MPSTAAKTAATLAATALIAVGGYWWGSPYLALRDLQQAAQAQDATRFNAGVDYPALRASLKEQTGQRVSDALGSPDNAGGLAGLGARLAQGMASPVIDGLVRPDVVMRVLQEGGLRPRGAHAEPAPATDTPPPAAAPRWTAVREDANTLVAYAADPQQPNTAPQGLGLVLRRTGFADWKLAAVRLPR